MKEYIKRSDIFPNGVFFVNEDNPLASLDELINRICNAPTIDAVPVVRCKDCKHNVANRNHDELDATDYSDITCDYFMTDGMHPDDFCSYGGRRDA